MKRTFSLIILWMMCITPFCTLLSQTIGFRGQWSGWAGISNPEDWNVTVGSRYVPELSGHWKHLDFEASFNGYWTQSRISGEWLDQDDAAKPYRVWLRYSRNQWEIRAGLQKINFGSAAMLRPLMWFDRIDPHDPLQMTDGVLGVLGRYYFPSNANIWLWGLIGNNNPKGWEVFGSDENLPELGGRFQFPVENGEMALTLHYRRASYSNSPSVTLYTGIKCLLSRLSPFKEYRVGLDGKYDFGPGLWFETVLIHQEEDIPILPYTYRHSLTLGADYTFGIGNGLHFMGEHLWFELADAFLMSGEGYQFSALSLNYPLGLLDQISAMLYYDWDNEEFYRFINVQRMYDKWSLYLMTFWNPDSFNLPQMQQAHTFFAGKGIQFMIVFNH